MYSVYLLAQIRPAEETAVRLKFRSCDQSISPWIEWGGGSFAFAVYLLYLIHVIHNSVNAQQRKQIGLQKLVCTADSVTLYAGGFF